MRLKCTRFAAVLSGVILSVLLLAGCQSKKEKTSDGTVSVMPMVSEKPTECQPTEGQPTEPVKRAAQEIIEELVVDYGNYGDEASEHMKELLKELESVDKDLSERWERITKLWMSLEESQTLHYDVLPDGLPTDDSLCIVALGFQLAPDGSMREELVERLQVVLRSAQKYPNAYIVCTGGGTATLNPAATEAGEMAKWLIENGVDETRVIVENNSLTTAQNAIYTLDILETKHPSVTQIAIVSSDYHIATGTLLFEAEAILRAPDAESSRFEVVSNASWDAPSGSLSGMFQAGALIELSGDTETAFEIYYNTYDIHELPPLNN